MVKSNKKSILKRGVSDYSEHKRAKEEKEEEDTKTKIKNSSNEYFKLSLYPVRNF